MRVTPVEDFLLGRDASGHPSRRVCTRVPPHPLREGTTPCTPPPDASSPGAPPSRSPRPWRPPSPPRRPARRAPRPTARTAAARPAPTGRTTVPARSPSARSAPREGPRDARQRHRGARAARAAAPPSPRRRPSGDAPTAFEFPVDKHGQDLHRALGVRRTGPEARHRPGPRHNAIPQPDRAHGQLDQWARGLQQGLLRRAVQRADGESITELLPQASVGPVHRLLDRRGLGAPCPATPRTYGANDVEDNGGSWQFIADTVDAWYADAARRRARPPAEIDAYLATVRRVGPLRRDSDGDFNEPDGYIDHFQAVHAGEGEEAGARPDAIWSHRWYVNGTDYGQTGPGANKLGGTQIGESGFWIGDYTVEPENGGLGVFAHEFAPRPRPPGLLRHRRWRERHRLLDAHVLRLVARPRRGRPARASAPRPA